ncbi:MAG: hypothetical protein UX87_C0002G0025 [Candidatus Amesbacteria bacterium GW2011_GWA1_47_16]|uniref:Uncharacterized protein n=4 Tax=Candidatus Amesiibacteriota TaxID=1752730 RepID=A0A1F4ZZZ8_9BACT|nr:MAG: hypothetical protein UX87_C0002G0025 [Candidatus Amesbacteria bacterium GW2011_GWA1_47_16]KKU98464.1 MAG: hypothetical protein UY28_C0001G0014 [Candidatus Amesbacteria bacterium GW2011_GWB1_48_13]OGD00320.1 MAG: hypothetical protein A2972_00740 [Candidatus Amesbacteria bacterium RIFCSPLOWO2_01_FULL_47_33]OGD00892.1 MAG: hypothetical protein A2701_00580 [Candidatus Amesbacteria bacterium RIFCSPHIGHO2_01_FULL_47_34]OGD11177.1 MAG: hypothetical protein A2395_03475 [Candidatus Amesbacteria 
MGCVRIGCNSRLPDWMRTNRLPMRWYLLNLFLLLPALGFWFSVIMLWSLGTDYWFDAVFYRIGSSPAGNVVINAMVVGLPAAAIPVNGMVYLTTKNRCAAGAIITAGLILVLGFWSVLKKF